MSGAGEHLPEIEALARTWGLPPTCTCPDDCDCDGILVCLVCYAQSRPHHAGREDHADLDQSLAAKRALRWDVLNTRPGECDCDYWHSKHRFHCATRFSPELERP